jgi:chaperonin GroES
MATATATPTKTKVKFHPTEDRAILPLEASDRTTGGIILPDTAKEKPQRGKVLAVGPGKSLKSGKRAAMNLRVGDEVIYGKYSGTEVDLGPETYVVVRESDVLAVVDK